MRLIETLVMAEDSTPSYGTQAGDNREGRESPGRGGRQTGPKEPGGLRIRLSDNEMKAARALQEAFGLRSPVAVLGFALRTLAQQLEAGQLDALVAQQRGEGAGRSRPRGEEGAGERRERSDRVDRGGQVRQVRVDPFARPSRPPAPTPTPLAAESEGADIEAASGEGESLLGTDALELEAVVTDSAESAAPEQAEAEA
ncbi:MAG: hypothetical protein NTZ40_08635 [Cyanobacteria bacterium]|nr:hypothetical protein [Cyanobacteriota bacterium]